MVFLFSQMCCCRVWSWKEKAVTRHGKFCSCQTLHFMEKNKKNMPWGAANPDRKKEKPCVVSGLFFTQVWFFTFYFFTESRPTLARLEILSCPTLARLQILSRAMLTRLKVCNIRPSHDCNFCHTLRPTTRRMHRVFRQDVCIESYDTANA